jgi:putative ABC transport system permease protein
MPRSADIALDTQTLLYTFAMVMLAASLTGLAPAWQLMRSHVYGALKAGSRMVTNEGRRLRGALVISQFVLAMVLLAGAGLLVRSFLRLLNVDPGFVTENVVTLSTQIGDLYRTPEQRLRYWRELTAQLEAVPGVRHVGVVSRLPLLGANVGSWLFIEGRNFPPNDRPDVEYRIASPGYFSAMGIPLLRGRLMDASNERNPSQVAWINEAAARRYWPGEDPVGKRIKLGGGDLSQVPWITIAGVVGDVRHFGLDERPRPEIYRPVWHSPMLSPILVVRCDRSAEAMIPELQGVFRRVEPKAPVYNVFAMDRLVERSLAPRRFPMLLLGLFAVMAAALASVGIYGVLAQMVTERAPELGVRMAVGARPHDVLTLILGDGIRLAVVGIALGLGSAALLSRFAAPLLYQTGAHDLVTFLLAPVVLCIVAMAACALPALRASRLDPARCLRTE